MHRECLDEISNIRQNLAHKDRMLEDLGNINGKGVAEVAKLRKALEAIRDPIFKPELNIGVAYFSEKQCREIAKEALA